MDSDNPQLSVQSQILILNLASFRTHNNQSVSRPPCCNGRLRFLAFFVTLLRWLGFNFATLSQAMSSPRGRFACLTVDGSALCIHDEIFPRLQALGVPATLFVPTKEIACTTSDMSGDAPSEEPSNTEPDHPPELTQVLAWHHVRFLKEQGWEIGASSHESVNLTERASEEQRRLIARAREVLGRRLGEGPRVFAYPFGAYDATTVSCLRDEGFEAAVTTKRGVNTPGASFAYHLRRIPLSTQRLRDLMAVFGGAFEVLRTRFTPSVHTSTEAAKMRTRTARSI